MSDELIRKVSDLISQGSKGAYETDAGETAESNKAEIEAGCSKNGEQKSEPDQLIQTVSTLILSSDEITGTDEISVSQAERDFAEADYERYRARGFLLREIAGTMSKHDIYLSLYKAYDTHRISLFNKAELVSALIDTVLDPDSFSRLFSQLNKGELGLMDKLSENGGFSMIYRGNDEISEALDRLTAKCLVYQIPGTINYCIPSDVMDLYIDEKQKK